MIVITKEVYDLLISLKDMSDLSSSLSKTAIEIKKRVINGEVKIV